MFNSKAFFALGFVLFLLVLPGAHAGPSCARRNRGKQSCMSLCAQKWGWPGNVMGSDPWGAVISPKGSSPTDALSTACGSGSGGNGALGSGSGNGNSNTTILIKTSASTPPASTTTAPSTPGNIATSAFSPSITPPSPPTASSASKPSSSSKPFSSSSPTAPSSASSPHTSSKPPLTTFQQLASPPPSQSTQPQSKTQQNQPQSSSPTQPSGNSDVQSMLQLHNNLRASHGAGALTWSNQLASAAQEWANKCVFQHSGGKLGPFGENLASGTGSYGAADAFKGWADEESSYNPNNPQESHYTQVVWKGTTQLGCAVATCAPGKLFPSNFGSANYYVCEYEAQGNVVGQFGSNVQA